MESLEQHGLKEEKLVEEIAEIQAEADVLPFY